MEFGGKDGMDSVANDWTLILAKGISGITKRDIQLFVEGGYNTIESVAYT